MDTLIYTSAPERLEILQKDTNPSSTITIHKDLESQLSSTQQNQLQRVIIDLDNNSGLQQTTFHSLYNAVKPDGTVQINLLNGDIASLKDLYTIAGFKEEISADSSSLVLKKPSWAGKGVATLKKKPANTTTVKLDANESTEEKKANPFAQFSAQAKNTDELINEDNLLENEAGYNRLGTDESCSTKPKACANCSCGRAEQEALEEESKTTTLEKKIETGKVNSSCGSCYLGDAFRCASCPYKGLPAFKPGDKVKLDLSKDSLGGVLKEENDVVFANGKVKLQI